MYDLTQGHFTVGSHARIETHAQEVQKMPDPVGIPQLERLRCQAIAAKQVLPVGGSWDQGFSFPVTRPKGPAVKKRAK